MVAVAALLDLPPPSSGRVREVLRPPVRPAAEAPMRCAADAPLAAALAAVDAAADPCARALAVARLAAIRPAPASVLAEDWRQALEAAAEDDEVLVRATLAEMLQHDATAPAAVVARLAEDATMAVAEPVIQHSPLIDAAALQALLARPAARVAVAARRAIGADLAQAIIATGDVAAIARLLGNHGALIAEEALYDLAEAAKHQPVWLAPLAAWPALPRLAALSLVAHLPAALLPGLALRDDLHPEAQRAVRAAIILRLEAEAVPDEAASAALARVDCLHAARLLLAELVTRAAGRGEAQFVQAAVWRLSGVEREVVTRIWQRGEASALTALAARAGLAAAAPAMVALLQDHQAAPERRARASRLGRPVQSQLRG